MSPATNTFPTLDVAYARVLNDVLENGIESSPRGMRTKELLHVSFTLSDARANVLRNPVRKINPTFAVAEWLWILLGRRDVRSVAYFNKNVAQFSDDGETFFGAYGPWVVAQLPHVVGSLQRDPDTRQAVMTIWQQSPPKTKDVPCTVALQFLLRGGELHAQAFMRSNDAWLGLPYDVFTFTRIQSYVAALVGVPTGMYTHTVGSLHLYERDWDGAKLAAAAYWPAAEPSPELTPMPADLAAAFETVSDPGRAASLYAGWEYGAGEPWSTYIGLLLYKTLKNRALLHPPYDAVIPQKEVA